MSSSQFTTSSSSFSAAFCCSVTCRTPAGGGGLLLFFFFVPSSFCWEIACSLASRSAAVVPLAFSWCFNSGKFKWAYSPLNIYAAVSYAIAASSPVSNVPNQTLVLFRGRRISATHFPQCLCRTPLNNFPPPPPPGAADGRAGFCTLLLLPTAAVYFICCVFVALSQVLFNPLVAKLLDPSWLEI
ncbi:hypothetical protein LINPERPRIM_LOCUS36426 [Linum perenne]